MSWKDAPLWQFLTFGINEETVFLFNNGTTGEFRLIYALLVLSVQEFVNSENSKQIKM